MSSLRLAHTSRSSDRNNSSSSGPGGITNEAFATSSISLYKRISSNENLSSSNMMNSISTSSHLNHLEAGPPHPAPRMMMMTGAGAGGQANSTTVLTVPGNSNSSTTLVGNASPKSRTTNENVNSSVNISPKHNSSPSSSTSSNAAAPYYQHQVHNHQTQPGQAELIAIKTKFEAEFRRFSLQRSEITNLDDFMKTIEHFHKLFTIPFCLFYTDPHHGDLLPINNDINFALAISSAKPLLRLIVQRKDGNYGYFPAGSTATHKKNFLGTLLPSSSSSHNTKPRLAISAPEDFRQVSSIIDVDIVPDTCRRVRLVKHGSDKPLGFYIRDGTSVRVTAHGVEKVPGIFISRLIPGGLAESTGLLAVNDEVLEVNGIEVNGKSLDQVTDMMVANSSNLIITIRPANQRGHSTLSGSFSSNTLSSSTNAPQNTFHTANQTNSLERGQRAKKTIPSIHPSDQFHNPHHPLHYSGGGHVINHNPQSSSSSSNAFESLQRSAQHRHSATIISTTNPGGSSSSGHHHFDPVSTFHHAHHPHQSHQHQPHSQHHHHHHHNQFSNNRHSVIGGPGVAEGLMVGTGGLGAPTSNVILARDHSGSNSSDDEEDEVRDHFTTSLVINSGADANKPSSSSLTGGQRTNGGIYNTTVTINHHPQTTLQSSSSSNVSSTTVPVNRTSSSGSTGSLGQGQGQGSGQAAAASAAAFIRNSLRTKNHPANAAGASGPTRTFVEDPRTSIYAHLYHHNQPSEGATAQQNPNPSSPSSSASSSPTVINKQIQNQRPGGPNNNASVDSDIVTL